MSADSSVSARTSRVGVDFVCGIRANAVMISCGFHSDSMRTQLGSATYRRIALGRAPSSAPAPTSAPRPYHPPHLPHLLPSHRRQHLRHRSPRSQRTSPRCRYKPRRALGSPLEPSSIAYRSAPAAVPQMRTMQARQKGLVSSLGRALRKWLPAGQLFCLCTNLGAWDPPLQLLPSGVIRETRTLRATSSGPDPSVSKECRECTVACCVFRSDEVRPFRTSLVKDSSEPTTVS